MYKKILVPYDFGNSFTNVPDQLSKLTDASEDYEIVIFNVITEAEQADTEKYLGASFSDIEQDKINDMKPFTSQLEELGLNYTTRFKTGRVIHELLEEINDNDYDLVLMSNRRSKRDIKHVLGHVTHKIAKRVNKPVMVVK
ncbi:universal stress protein [Salinicoccus albus]|uniref:universal stress protein n=1 Tax=Salinicoccus albus TaxID=418756 RepID=UPI0003631964|nr:universal stress protein [Salinicoccus albus]